MNDIARQPQRLSAVLRRSRAGCWFAAPESGDWAQFPLGHQRELRLDGVAPGSGCTLEIVPRDEPWRVTATGNTLLCHFPQAVVVGGRSVPVVARQERALAAMRRFLARALPPDQGFAADLGAAQQVRHYRSVVTQRRYTHMYAAKSIALWRAVRDVLGWRCERRGALVSIGAGPRLDLMGWSFDTQWIGPVLAADPLDWSGVLDDLDWRRAVDWLVGPVQDAGRCYVPPGVRPPQLGELAELRSLPLTDIPIGSTVLMPFVANHLLEDGRPHAPSFEAFGRWLRDLAERRCRIVIADKGRGPGHLWPAVLRAAGAEHLRPAPFRFDRSIDALPTLYAPTHADYRSGRRHEAMRWARVLVLEQGTWRFLTHAGAP